MKTLFKTALTAAIMVMLFSLLAVASCDSDSGPLDDPADTYVSEKDTAPQPDMGKIPCEEDDECDDGDPCTSEGCVSKFGVKTCKYVFNDNACDDGNPLTVDDACDNAGTCVGNEICSGTDLVPLTLYEGSLSQVHECVPEEFAWMVGEINGQKFVRLEDDIVAYAEVKHRSLVDDEFLAKCPTDTKFILIGLPPRGTCLHTDLTLSICVDNPNLCNDTYVKGSIYTQDDEIYVHYEIIETTGKIEINYRRSL